RHPTREDGEARDAGEQDHRRQLVTDNECETTRSANDDRRDRRQRRGIPRLIDLRPAQHDVAYRVEPGRPPPSRPGPWRNGPGAAAHTQSEHDERKEESERLRREVVLTDPVA